MATGKISKRTVDSIEPAFRVQFLWDNDPKGFGVKIMPAGAISYLLQFRMGGREAKTRRYTIGTHGSPWTPATARNEAERLSLLIAQGTDPVDADKKCRRRKAVDLAFVNYADRFACSCKGEGWRRLVERSTRLYLTPVLGRKALPNITRTELYLCLTRCRKDRLQIAATYSQSSGACSDGRLAGVTCSPARWRVWKRRRRSNRGTDG